MTTEGQNIFDGKKRVAIFSGQGGLFDPNIPFNIHAQQELYERQMSEFREFRRLTEGADYFDLVYGHSVGEIAAAEATGVFATSDAKLIAVTRDRLFNTNPKGAMAVVTMPIDKLNSRIQGTSTEVAIFYDGTINVISGEVSEIKMLEEEFGRKVRRLAIPRAAHHPLTQPVQDEMEKLLNSITFSDPLLPMIDRNGQLMLTGAAVRNELVNAHTHAVYVSEVVNRFSEQGIKEGWEFGGDTVLNMINRMDSSLKLRPITEFDYEALLHSVHS
jgi:malonyl CoA-acyl carrier protein transacylase